MRFGKASFVKFKKTVDWLLHHDLLKPGVEKIMVRFGYSVQDRFTIQIISIAYS